MASAAVIYAITWIILIYAMRDGRLSWSDWPTHNGQLALWGHSSPEAEIIVKLVYNF